MPQPATETIDLGRGHSASLVWLEHTDRDRGLPVGVIVRHGSCRVYLAWAALDGDATAQRWNLESLRPLTLDPGVICPTCGIEGRIKQGRWVNLG